MSCQLTQKHYLVLVWWKTPKTLSSSESFMSGRSFKYCEGIRTKTDTWPAFRNWALQNFCEVVMSQRHSHRLGKHMGGACTGVWEPTNHSRQGFSGRGSRKREIVCFLNIKALSKTWDHYRYGVLDIGNQSYQMYESWREKSSSDCEVTLSLSYLPCPPPLLLPCQKPALSSSTSLH